MSPKSQRYRGAWLLLAMLLAIAAFVTAPLQTENARRPFNPHEDIGFVSRQPPEVTAPTGLLNTIYKTARPAALRIEVRSSGVFVPFVEGVGTGFFISPEGQVLTAYHVVERVRGDLIGVDADDKEYALELLAFDAYLDVALLQAEVDAPVAYLPLNNDTVPVGSEIVAIGNSRGDFLEARAGQVTRLGVEAARADFASGTIELTAALAPGDSGGPVLNERGEVIGVVSYISFMPGTEGGFVPPFLRDLGLLPDFASYAVPVARSGDLFGRLQAGDQRDVPVIGFSLYEDYVPRADNRNLGPLAGPVVYRVQPASPAEAAGLLSLQEQVVRNDTDTIMGRRIVADVIVAVNNERTRNFNELLTSVRSKRIGETVTLQVQRGNETIFLELELGAKAEVFR